MRVLGVLLILFGILLCFTIIAAPFGVFLMIIGAICCAVGGRRRTVINNVVQVSSTPGPSFMQANLPDDERRDRRAKAIEPPMQHATRVDYRPDPPMIDVTSAQPQSANGFSYDRVKWDALVRYDPEISRIAEALRPYGQKYTDELASAYLALNDKAYLPMIIKKILESAKQDAAAR
jgi:hypothetical protein